MALLSILQLLFVLHHSFYSQAEQISKCEGGNYSANSTFQYNLNILLSTLSSSNGKFSTATIGTSPNRIYGLVLCRGDLNPSYYCTPCYKMLSHNVTLLCPTSTEATVWDRHCELHYSDMRFFNSIDMPEVVGGFRNSENSSFDTFANMSRELYKDVSFQAAFNSSSLMFATGLLTYSTEPTIYSYAQCTMDLSRDMCSRCLDQILQHYWSCCRAYLGGWFVGKSCSYGYEAYPFYMGDPTLTLTLPPSSSPPPASTPTPLFSPPTSGEAASQNTRGKKKVVLVMVISLAVEVVFLH